jgi:hypothetical protein
MMAEFRQNPSTANRQIVPFRHLGAIAVGGMP